jgi:hypothetical protein
MLRPTSITLALSVSFAAGASAGEPPAPPALPVVTPTSAGTAGMAVAEGLLSGEREKLGPALDALVARLSGSDARAREFRIALEEALLGETRSTEAMFATLVLLAQQGPAEAEWARKVAEAGGPRRASRLAQTLDPGRIQLRLYFVKDLVARGHPAEAIQALAAKEISGATTASR